VAPAGSMLAPMRIAVFLPMLAADMPQLTTRKSEMLMWMTGLGQSRELALQRLAAADVLSGYSDDFAALRAVLDRYRVRTVVVEAERYELEPVRRALEQRGYRELARVAGTVVTARAP